MVVIGQSTRVRRKHMCRFPVRSDKRSDFVNYLCGRTQGSHGHARLAPLRAHRHISFMKLGTLFTRGLQYI